MTRRLAPVVLALVALAACARRPAAPSDSGIEGMVLLGPMCPVVQEGTPCPDKPFEADIRVVDLASGGLIETAHSGVDGRFVVSLAPGEYLLDPVPPSPGGLPFAAPVQATVRAHEFTQVTISFDSGIR